MSLRGGGREAVEDEPIEPTGMQIAIAERMFDEWCQYNGSDTGWSSSEVDDDTRSVWIELAGVAVAEIEYDHAIVRAEDALTAEDRAAIRDGISVIDGVDLSLEKLQDAEDMFDVSTTQVDFREYRNCLTADGIARIRAIAEGGQA